MVKVLNATFAGHAVVRSPVMNTAQQPIVPLHIETEPTNSSTPIHNSSSVNKRKASKSASKVPSAPKRKRTEPLTKSSMVEGDTQNPKQM